MSSSSANAPAPPMRILCLHDADSNAAFLQTQALRRLGDRLLNHNIELVYVNAALVTQQETDEDDQVSNNQHNSPRSWWQSTVEHPYLGLDASLLLVKHVWQSNCNFSGILGIGQGAALGALLMLSLWEDYSSTTPSSSLMRTPPKHTIFINGYTVLPEDFPLLSVQQCQVLHILPAENDNDNGHIESMPSDAARHRLVTQVGGQVHVRQTAEPWYSTECLNRMGRFLVHNKTSANDAITRLQHALVQTEQDAAALVQHHARSHPPPSLMAVIGPSAHISGWSFGAKDNKPAGGAPCPADFKLPVHKRGGQGNDENTHVVAREL